MGSTDHRRDELKTWLNQQTGFSLETLEMVSGDASFRRYFRFLNDGKSYIAVDAPPEFEDCEQFVEVARRYSEVGLPVPHIYAVDYKNGFYCQQDFGNTLLSDKLSLATADDLYRDALALLPKIQQCVDTSRGPLPKFDHELLEREFYLFTHWLVIEHLQLQLSESQLRDMQDTFSFLTSQFFEQPQVGVHRDYHSRNLMLLDDNQIGVIDFQDAVLGPITYDAVSLLRDCYQIWPMEKVEQWLLEYHQHFYPEFEFAQFKRWFDFTGLQRHIKASGIFARLCHRDGKRAYLKDIPATLAYIVSVAKGYPESERFGRLVESTILPALKAKTQ